MWTQDGVTTYPWFSSLFDRNYFENAVDIFFNLLMVASVPVIGIWYGGLKYFQKNEPVKRPRRRKIQRMTFTLIALVFGTYITMLVSPYEEPYRTYHEDYIAAQEDDSVSIEATFALFRSAIERQDSSL